MKESLEQIAKDIIQAINTGWMGLGRKDLTSRVDYDITEDGGGYIVWIQDETEGRYIKHQDRGVRPENIPFTPNAERAARGWEKSPFKTSKYIQGLVNFAKTTLGATDKDAVSIAFAIAHKHKETGNPTDKEKLGFVDKATKNEVKNIVQKHLGALIVGKIKWR
jgi:hypothetical protein